METLLSEHSFNLQKNMESLFIIKVILIVIFLQLTTLDMPTPPGCDGLHSIIICTLFLHNIPSAENTGSRCGSAEEPG